MESGKERKVCFIASSGGHWEELMCLKSVAQKYDAFYVTEEGGQANDASANLDKIYRERNHDDAILSSSDVVIRRNDREQMEENPVAKRKDSIYLFSKHRDVAIIASLGYIPAIRHLL